MVTIFNEIFGWTFVFMAGKTIAHILATCMGFLEKDAEVTNIEIRFSSFMITCLSIVNLTLVMCGTSVTTESSKTAFLCYKLQEHFPPKSDERLEILILAKQIIYGWQGEIPQPSNISFPLLNVNVKAR
ncbi:hypothetical protein Zmor_010029 [Zophobas morio]|uniref:Uncharacterized protein n=1 Tax=Zophobas morio TaxID=2755281 RepID=A0AA38INJ6_9CUCU|nr:hypothetical protein Zmor_010029 [Zophobas morio]